MADFPVIPAPPGLGTQAKRLWKSVVSAYVLRPDEKICLEMACRTLDTIVELDAAMEGQPLVVIGSMGQQREHPLLSEARQQRGALARLLAQLKLPEEATSGLVGNGALGRSTNARAAARARWKVG